MIDNDDGLIAAAQPDGFTHESPIRAFTEFRVAGTWAIGKGFRPSLAHLHTYLDAMQRKEGWHMVQLLDGGTLDPTLIFQRDRVLSFTVPDRLPTGSDAIALPDLKPSMSMISYLATFLNVEDETLSLEFNRTTGDSIMQRLVRCPILHAKVPTELEAALASYRDRYLYRQPPEGMEFSGPVTALQGAVREMGADSPIAAIFAEDAEAAAIEDDCDDQEAHGAQARIAAAINPKHYGGRFCADIGERLSANGFQMLRYTWRLGKKDDPCQEIGKALWYCDSEIALLGTFGAKDFISPKLAGLPQGGINDWFRERIEDQSTFTQNIARMLWEGYNVRRLVAIREALAEHQFHLDCGRGLAL
jgi:hypothetical protein